MREELFLDDVDGDEDHMVPAATAYIKTINLDEARALGAVIPPEDNSQSGDEFFALNSEDGTTIVVSDSRAIAYIAALKNNFLLLSVH